MVISSLKWTSIASSEVVDKKCRLEASVFNVDVKKAQDDIAKCKFEKVKIWSDSDNSPVIKAHYGGRLKRMYVSKSAYAVGFLGSSEMLQLNPKPEKYFSISQSTESLRVKEGTILVSRSGTIGNMTYVNKTLSKFLVSEHAIRLEPRKYGGYLYSFLQTVTGQLLIKSNIFGAVISQIEPEHIGDIEIPNPPDHLKESIHKKIEQSFLLRDKSNLLIKEAEELLITALKLPAYEDIKPEYFKKGVIVKTFTVPFLNLHERLDGSFHEPSVNVITDFLLDNSERILSLSNTELTKEILLPGRFKRHYVSKDHGKVFFGGKQIFEINPANKKYLSLKQHGNRIEAQLFLHQNTILVTRSGTIGRVNIVPKHWENWVANEHVLRVIPADYSIAGYLYIWLNSDYGRVLISHFTYGSVVDEIDDKQLGSVAVPILSDKPLMGRINNLALEANQLRTEAYLLEQEAIEQVNLSVIYA